MTFNAAACLLETGNDCATALICGDESMSYGELRHAVRRAGGAWQDFGLKPGERVVLFAPDSIDWVVTYLGAIWAGGVPIGINCRLPGADLLPILDESRCVALWSEAPVAGAARNIGPLAWQAALSAAAEVEACPRSLEDPALWIGTSGTTGRPKGVIHAHRCVRAAHSFATGRLGLSASDRIYATSKLFFAYALGNSLFAGLRAGATVILDREWPTPERVEQIVADHHPTLFFSVPTLYHKMVETGTAHRIAGLGIRHFVSAGEVLPAPVRADWEAATGLAPISGYGTSETLCLMLYSDCADGSFMPTPQTEVRFDTSLDPAVPQRIRVKHDAVALGYWERPEAQADGFVDGGYSPGDMFLRRPDGRLEYAGRNDDMLKIAGQWVSTLWVEQSLVAAGGDCIQQLAVVGVPSDDGLMALAVLVIAMPGRQADANERMRQGIEQLPGHRRPRWVHWVESLPLTATGKLQRGQLRRLHEVWLARKHIKTDESQV